MSRVMNPACGGALLAALAFLLAVPIAHAEILALVNYEAKPEAMVRREGLAVLDVDPNSASFGNLLMDVPLPPNSGTHHIYLNEDRTKAYVTALARSVLYVLDLTRFPYRIKVIAVPDCQGGEDIVFSDDNRTWYLTCITSDAIIVGDAGTDQPLKTIRSPLIRHPHGIALHGGIDRILVTSTVASDLGDPGETVTVLEASTGKVLSAHIVSNKPSPSGAAPVEILFHQQAADPPIAYITNMFEGTLWLAVWNPSTKGFSFRQVDDFGPRGHGIPLEMERNRKRDRLYVTTAKPGHLSVYDITVAAQPKFLKAIPAAPGAHHLVLSPDERYVFVQNSLLNLPGMNDGSITVIDAVSGTAIASVGTLKYQGLNPNCIVLLPAKP